MRLVIKEFPKYSIEDSGVVWNNERQKPLKAQLLNHGYFAVRLAKTTDFAVTKLIHHLVAEAFIGPRPRGLQINHKDGIKTNNHFSNLEYVTRSENARHMYRLGLHEHMQGEKCGKAKLTTEDVLRIRSSEFAGLLHKEIAEIFGVKKSIIGEIKNRKRWRHL
jgi:hypothetical protein